MSVYFLIPTHTFYYSPSTEPTPTMRKKRYESWTTFMHVVYVKVGKTATFMSAAIFD